MPRRTGRKKHIPQRTCIGCREVLSKMNMVRIVRTGGGVEVDPSGKIAGRGAYLHNVKDCWDRGLKGPLAAALKTQMKASDLEKLHNYINALIVSEVQRDD